LVVAIGLGVNLLPSFAGARPELPDRLGAADDALREQDDNWLAHPALRPPDGQSRRAARTVGDDIQDSRVLAELSRRFLATKEFTFVKTGDRWELQGSNDFETRQEYFLRLLDYYLFSKDRLTGMTRKRIEGVFGPGCLEEGVMNGRLSWDAGRDSLIADIENGRVVDVQYIMGY
jgi:hypothetical protein